MISKFVRGTFAAAALTGLILPAAAPAQIRPKATTKASPVGTVISSPVLTDLHFAIEAQNREGVDPLILDPGEGFRINEGQRLVIRAVGTESGRARIYPAVRYFIVSGADSIALRDARPNMGTVAVDAISPARQQRAVIGYQIQDHVLIEGEDREGRIEVEIVALRADYDARRANALVADLYRGILLREPDRAAANWVSRIDRDGYDGLVQVARALAESEESRKGVYGRGVCDQQRLLAVYKNFLGLSEKQIPIAEWERALQMMDQRRYADLVTELLARQEFFARRDLDAPRQMGYLQLEQ
jgi:hypothetical protein